MSIRKDLDGLRMKLPGNPAIYLIDQGRKRHIPDVSTYNSLFADGGKITEDISVNDIDTGASISTGAVLAQAHGEVEVYLVESGSKRHIASTGTMDRYHFDWSKRHFVPSIIIASIPPGASIVWPE